ncbi:MAG: AAA family ATPase [Nitrospiraceae bacterium]|nr:AAA family ATPase [Nitrospiraceae bacterium]
MRISRIQIEYFRSLQRVDITPGNFNVLVGQNNHGKTNIFEAIEWFYTGKGEVQEIRHCDADPKCEVSVTIEFAGVQNGIKDISNKDNQTKLLNILGDNDVMSVRRSSASPKDRSIYHPASKEWKKQPTGADSAFNNCIPRFEFVEATKSLKDVTQFKNTTPIGQMLSGVITDILEKDPTYQKFRETFESLFQSEKSKVKATLDGLSAKVREHLAQQFPDCSKVEFSVSEPAFDEFLKNYKTRLDDGVETTAEEKGDGMQRALMLAIIKTHADYRRDQALGRAFIFFIDEAELHLHPTAQRQLKTALLALAQSVDQVFITTHSSVFIADEHPAQLILKVEKIDKTTTVEPIDRFTKQHVVYGLLGGSPADLLLPPNFIIVEGPSEDIFLRSVIERFYGDRSPIQVIPACGDDERQRQNMEAINLVFNPLKSRPIYKEKLTMLFDLPNAAKLPRFEEFKRGNAFLERNGQLHVLPVGSLEEYYPAALRSRFSQLNDKIKLAKKMATEITQEQFEREMPVIFDALRHCWDNAYVE